MYDLYEYYSSEFCNYSVVEYLQWWEVGSKAMKDQFRNFIRCTNRLLAVGHRTRGDVGVLV
ncbi:hypothetical protein [Paenibacillus polymyxa]|jgi:tRNA(Ile)-lysidine synthase TilS/MesJ|uniref:hypothetical protein n=1 Tax=Paenibacillus polymyxa TaxID=1406 RepID=UPI00083DFD36|nr:hypothetical protein [Paenibacillus polymyxa]ODB61386.1 hypothetical protein A7309_15175 [Paenibacillus polymyxa]